MHEHKLGLSEIREKLKAFTKGEEAREFLACDTVPGGVPRGVLCEITGSARTEWVLRLLKQNPNLNTFWAEKTLTILPTSMIQRGIDLKRVLLAETDDKLVQTLRKALKSKLFDCLVLPGTIHEVKILKALQLFARESNACVLFLSQIKKTSWSIPFQIEASWTGKNDPISVQILKSKFSHEPRGEESLESG